MGHYLVPRGLRVFGGLLVLLLPSVCACSEENTPDEGWPHSTVTLKALSYHNDLEAASLSIEHGVTGSSDAVGGDWDLVFGIDEQSDLDVFAVRHTPDDLSFIVDLGPIPLDTVPMQIDADSYPPGLWGEHDHVPVIAGHVYAVRTLDADSRLWGVVQVLAHRLNRSVILRWRRSVSPDQLRFLRPRTPVAEIYFQEDFEDGDSVANNWTFTGDWEWGMPRGVEQEPPAAFSGSTCLGTRMSRNYSYGYRCLDNLAISPIIDLSGASDPVLVYQQWLDLPDSYDGTRLWIRRIELSAGDTVALPQGSLVFAGVIESDLQAPPHHLYTRQGRDPEPAELPPIQRPQAHGNLPSIHTCPRVLIQRPHPDAKREMQLQAGDNAIANRQLQAGVRSRRGRRSSSRRCGSRTRNPHCHHR